MLVKATYIRRTDVPADLRTPLLQRWLRHDGDIGLVRGREYVVYAVQSTAEGRWFFIDDHGHGVYPFAYPADLFEVVDARVSRLWAPPSTATGVQSIPAWVEDEAFYDKLVEGNDDGQARAIFARAKEAMDVELVVPGRVQATGVRVGDGWVQCGACEYLWEERSSESNEMCWCRNCRLLLGLRRGT